MQVGAGTNNSRIAGLLRTLSTFYKTEPDHLFVVRLAQGLLHCGKGLISMSAFHSDRLLLAPTALGKCMECDQWPTQSRGCTLE